MTTQSIVNVPQHGTGGSLTFHRTPLPALTGIRFVAAIQVVLFHFGAGFAGRHNAPVLLTNALANGWTAVTLFFILSGFILSYTYCGQIEEPGGKTRFWEARFARIYPVYFLSLILCWPFNSHPGPGLSIAVFTMVQNWNPFHVEYGGAWNMPAWTLSTEAFFYLLFPFVLPLLEKCSVRALRFVAAATLLLIVFGHTMTHAIDPLTRVTGLPLPVFRFPEFLAGMTLGLIFLRSPRPSPRPWLSLAAILSLLVILCFVKGSWLSLMAIPLAVLIYELAAGNSLLARFLGSRPLTLLGGASYAIYLLQEPVRSWLHVAVTGSYDLRTAKGGIDVLLSPVVLVIFSIGVFLLWEEPMRKQIRLWFKRHNRASPVKAA
ncbi:acyltransferase family protein [Silvibacterium acidisoli]|uniref:acyltransferase family protein n=1 Tax=Acidobacteriaceae bacterium ZG23-2 TaxID=2883246 RepID=UPI00406C7C0F